MSPFRLSGMKAFSLRLLLTPAFFFILWMFYFNAFKEGMDVSLRHSQYWQFNLLMFSLRMTQERTQLQTTYATRNSLVFNSLAGAYFMSIIVTGSTCNILQVVLLRPMTYCACSNTVAIERTRYYQESREGTYSGPLFLLSNLVQSIPASVVTTLAAAFLLFKGLKTELLCTENPATGERSCRAHSSYSQVELETIEREGINNWTEYDYYPGTFSELFCTLYKGEN